MSTPGLRISWVHPDMAERIRRLMSDGRASWEQLFEAEQVAVGASPAGLEIPAEAWPALAEHVARAERVREMVVRAGLDAAIARFAGSPHAVERAALIAERDQEQVELADFAGVLACPVDEWIAYGYFLSRLVELGAAGAPDETVRVYKNFVAAAVAIEAVQTSWAERLRVARDGLAALYARVGRVDDAEAVYGERFAEEPSDVTVAIGAARVFLEYGKTLHAIAWLERAAERAAGLGREDLRARLAAKVVALRGRVN